MKATNTITNSIIKSLIIIVSVLFIQFNTVYAGKNIIIPPASPNVITLIQALAPASPETCDFNDAELNINDFSNLAPVVPAVADFNDTEIENTNIADLVPTTPSEAEFND
ncbi:MAG: hypothetical protein NTY96_11640 [Bacteroidetes bacterium]|nr:hypothetical protein [Bacteroidota bacterium]